MDNLCWTVKQEFLYCFYVLMSYDFTIENDEKYLSRDCFLNFVLKSPSEYYDETFIQCWNCFCDSCCWKYGECCQWKNSLNSSDYKYIDYLSPTMNEEISLFNPLLSVAMRTKYLSIYVRLRSDINCWNLNQ